MSSRAQALQKRYPVGSTVKIVMKNKDEYHGVVLEHGDDYLILRDTAEDEAFVSYDERSSGKRLEKNASAEVQSPPSASAIPPVTEAERTKSELVLHAIPPLPLSLRC